MKFRLVVCLHLCVVAGFGQYVWDYSKNPVVSDGTRWSTNGSPSYGTYGVNFSGSGGSLISIPAISGVNSSDYEVTSTLAINGGGGTYIHFFRTSGGTVQAGSGSYISAEIVIPSGFTSPGPATLNINQCVSGTVTSLASTSITATNGMTFRTIVTDAGLMVFNSSNAMVASTGLPTTTGNPGIGGYGIPAGSGFQSINLGHDDLVPPNAVSLTSISTSVFPNSVSLKWQGVLDDPAGSGVWEYKVRRNGVIIGFSMTAEFTDPTALPSTTYTYSLSARDFHLNTGAWTTVSVTTPATGAVDPRRTGVYTTGSYWGGGGEQIDTLSGNLSFSLPLLTAQGRTGWTVPVGLVYSSQNWRQDSGVNWKLSGDVGYGFGWQMLIGSVTPYYQGLSFAIDHYVYTDSTGAQYLLNVNTSGVWSGTNGVYVWFDSNTDKLHFKDGSFWVMGSTSGGTEADAGTMYPTIIEDVSGNQITVGYGAGAGLSSGNTSARIGGIVDAREAHGASYWIFYNSDTPVPHLIAMQDLTGAGANYSFTYNEGVALAPPFGADPSYAGLTTTQLASVTALGSGPWQFTYDSAGASELLQATFPWGGHLRWTYGTDPYSGSRDLRAVSARYLAADSAGATEWSYGISRDNAAASGAVVHGTMTRSDASGVGAKTWNFTHTNTDPAWQIGLAKEFVQSASSGGTVLQDDLYTWSQDPAGNPYISTKASTIGQGTPNVQTATSTQTLDQYGNVTQSVVYPYNNTSTPLKTFTNTYLNSSTYTSNYIFNRLVSSSVTPAGGSVVTLVTNTYDHNSNCSYSVSSGSSTPCSGWAAPASAPAYNVDPSPPIPVGARGYLTASVTPSKSTSIAVYTYGSPAMVWGSDGTVSSASADTSTDFNAPVTITSQSYSTTLAYNSWLGVTQTTGANGEQMSMTYDAFGRPGTATSAYCLTGCYAPTESYSYGTSNPFTQTRTGADGKTVTTLDGLGRAIRVDRGDTTSMQSSTATVYAPCACSPLAKIQKTSQPYAYGSSASAWTTYSYDGLGRPLTVQQPDGASTTTYVYSGNVTTVTDPAGKWKQFTTDVAGNLVTVTEPDPANPPSGTLATTYTYDWMNHVTGVSMARAGTTQTRSFVYDTVGRLTSAANPENGTVSYAYNSDNTLNYKTDAKGQQTVYTYDSLKRTTMTQYFPNGTANPEDGCQRVTYSYDTNPYVASFSQNSYGRLTAVLYGASSFCAQGPGAGMQTYFAEMYSYHPAGAVLAKQLRGVRGSSGSLTPASLSAAYLPNVEVDYTYDGAGRTATTTYPMAYSGNFLAPGSQPVTLTYGYDSMGRHNALTDLSGATGTGLGWPTGTPVNWAQNVQYDYAGRMSSMQYFTGFYYYTGISAWVQTWSQESMNYNVNGQLGSLGWVSVNWGGPTYGVQYNYSATQNNGQITQAVDTLSGETISYQYDALKRLTSASSTPNVGSYPAAYTQAFQYDGFGNLTAKVLNGTTTTIGVNAANNRLSSASYDANGNMTSGSGATMVYDEANRISSAAAVSGGIEYYGYTADNKRFYKCTAAGGEEITFFGARGEKLGEYVLDFSLGYYIFPVSTNIWFAGKAILESGMPSMMDRLGTNRYNSARFYPYGDEISSTGNDREKFATYTRDSYTGFDYADQRYYASTYGRFNTADPYVASGGTNDPGSWNRYSYTGGDPVNRLDPRGTCYITTYSSDSQGNFTVNCFDISEVALTGANASYAMFCMSDPICYSTHMPSSGGGALPPSPQQVAYGFAQSDQSLVQDNVISDCQGIAGFAGSIAPLFSNSAQFVQAFGVFVPITGETTAAGIAGNTSPIALVGPTSGYSPLYQNTNGDPSDQSHHFAAFFELGYQWGVTASTGVGELRELVEGVIGSLSGGYGYNKGDVQLAIMAAAMGGALKNNSISTGQVAGLIQTQLCGNGRR